MHLLKQVAPPSPRGLLSLIGESKETFGPKSRWFSIGKGRAIGSASILFQLLSVILELEEVQ